MRATFRARTYLRRVAPLTPRPLPTPAPAPSEEMDLWTKVSLGMVAGFCVPFTTYVIAKELMHHEHEHGPTYSHMRIRRKAFPWDASDCSFFDRKCINAYKSGGAAAAHH